jgi:hypothetical protein
VKTAEHTRPLAARVRFARRGLAAARSAECILIGASALCLTLAAAAASGAALGAVDAWGVAIGCGALASGAWWLEHRRAPAQVARAIDRARALEGALITAWEVEARGDAVGRALGLRVLRRLTARDALRAVLPFTAPLLALPFAAAALLAVALDAGRDARGGAGLAPITGRLESQLAGAGAGEAADAAGVSTAERHELADLARRAEALERARANGDWTAEETLEELRDLGEAVERVRRALPARSALRRRLEQARGTLDTALAALGEGSGAPGGEDLRGEAGGAGTGAAAQGMMGGPPNPVEGPAAGPEVAAGGGGAGVVGGRWWPGEHDEIVERWVESRRRPGEREEP